jgi:hypothetical protein
VALQTTPAKRGGIPETGVSGQKEDSTLLGEGLFVSVNLEEARRGLHDLVADGPELDKRVAVREGRVPARMQKGAEGRGHGLGVRTRAEKAPTATPRQQGRARRGRGLEVLAPTLQCSAHSQGSRSPASP